MRCVHCGKEVNDNRIFCMNCGRPVKMEYKDYTCDIYDGDSFIEKINSRIKGMSDPDKEFKHPYETRESKGVKRTSSIPGITKAPQIVIPEFLKHINIMKLIGMIIVIVVMIASVFGG